MHFLKRKCLYDSEIDGSVQDCSNSGALAMELLQSCTNDAIDMKG